LFANEDIGASGLILVGMLVVVPVAAAGGAMLLLVFQRKYNLSSKTMIYVCLFGFFVLIIYGLIGFATTSFGKDDCNLYWRASYNTMTAHNHTHHTQQPTTMSMQQQPRQQQPPQQQ